MKCPECIKEDKKSIVYVGSTMSTAMYFEPYYDEEGEFHTHDGNIYTSSYSCSNGHSWQEKSSGYCKCGWKSAIVK